MAAIKSVKHVYKVGDTGPPLVFQHTDDNNAVIDITGWTINFHLKRPTGSSALTILAVLTDPANGVFTINFSAGDFVAGRDQLADVEFNTGSFIFHSPQFFIDVEAEIV